MNTFPYSIRASSSLMKSYKFCISLKVYRAYLRYSIFSNSVKYPLLQVFIISCMPIIHISPTSMANARKQFLDDAQVFYGPCRTRTCDRSVILNNFSNFLFEQILICKINPFNLIIFRFVASDIYLS